MSELSAERFLKQYLEMTLILKSAIEAMDIDIIMNVLVEKDRLISLWEESGQTIDRQQHSDIVNRIEYFDQENEHTMDEFFKKVQVSQAEDKRKLQGVVKSKSISDRYTIPYSEPGHSSINLKR